MAHENARVDDTDKIERNVCYEHSGVCANMKNVKGDIVELWRAVGQIRMMFAVTMISTVGTLIGIVWTILSKKVGL